ncbi:MAG: TIGR03067 domain-containing protein [Rhodanobacteraceae bacterium]
MNDDLPDATDRDLAVLQGQWQQVGFEADGRSDSPDEFGPLAAITMIDGHRFSVHAAGGGLLLDGTFTLDASVCPKAITWMDSIGADAGKCLPAIYELAGDRFVFIAADDGEPRPTVFHTKPGQVMRIFVRLPRTMGS